MPYLWEYLKRTDEMIHDAHVKFGTTYRYDISAEVLNKELLHLKTMHMANFEEKALDLHVILNRITEFQLEEIFKNVCTALRIFCTLPVTVASAECSFSNFKLIKNFMRSTMTHDKLKDLAALSIESEIEKNFIFMTSFTTLQT